MSRACVNSDSFCRWSWWRVSRPVPKLLVPTMRMRLLRPAMAMRLAMATEDGLMATACGLRATTAAGRGWLSLAVSTTSAISIMTISAMATSAMAGITTDVDVAAADLRRERLRQPLPSPPGLRFMGTDKAFPALGQCWSASFRSDRLASTQRSSHGSHHPTHHSGHRSPAGRRRLVRPWTLVLRKVRTSRDCDGRGSSKPAETVVGPLLRAKPCRSGRLHDRPSAGVD